MLLSEGFLEQHRDDIEVGPEPATLVRFVRGEADLPAFQRHASAAVGHEVVVQFTADDEAAAINRTLGVQTVGLGILAAVASIGTLAAIAQALSRLLDGALAELPILVAMGVEPRQRLILGGLLGLPIALLGAAVAAAVAFLASPLVPTGLARAVDPARGHRLDLTVVTATATLWIVALAGAGVAAAWRHRVVPERHRPEGRTRRLLRPLPLRARLGCEAALTPLNRAGGAASRSAMMAFVVSLAGVTAIATFGASLDHLLAAPVLQGWSFDAVIVNGETDLDSLRVSLAPLSQDSAVSEVAWAAVVDIAIKDTMVEAYAFDPDAGNLHPTMRSGRPPRAEDEIALGADIMRGLGASLGDTVEISGPTGRERLTIVGSATYPELGHNGDLGSTVSLTRAAAQRVGAPEHGGGALIRLHAGQGPAALAAYGDVGEIITPFAPARVRNLRQIGQLPWLLVALASTLGVLAFAHGLWVSIRGRRRDLAVLASVGFRRRDIRAMHLWQATCIAAIGAVTGVAAGVIVGTIAWSTVATATAVVDRHVVPAVVLLLIAGGSFLACNLIALAETSRARRTTIAAGLRGE
jgi:ABC-type lipoprotein release transport system permease subunit